MNTDVDLYSCNQLPNHLVIHTIQKMIQKGIHELIFKEVTVYRKYALPPNFSPIDIHGKGRQKKRKKGQNETS